MSAAWHFHPAVVFLVHMSSMTSRAVTPAAQPDETNHTAQILIDACAVSVIDVIEITGIMWRMWSEPAAFDSSRRATGAESRGDAQPSRPCPALLSALRPPSSCSAAHVGVASSIETSGCRSFQESQILSLVRVSITRLTSYWEGNSKHPAARLVSNCVWACGRDEAERGSCHRPGQTALWMRSEVTNNNNSISITGEWCHSLFGCGLSFCGHLHVVTWRWDERVWTWRRHDRRFLVWVFHFIRVI